MFALPVSAVENERKFNLGKIFLELLEKFDGEEVKIHYLSAGVFDMRVLADDFKEAKQKMSTILEKLELHSKELKCEFSSKEVKQ